MNIQEVKKDQEYKEVKTLENLKYFNDKKVLAYYELDDLRLKIVDDYGFCENFSIRGRLYDEINKY